MDIALWITMLPTHEIETIIAFPRQEWLRERACFYVLLTVHLGRILVNNQLDVQFLWYMFISILYMFRAPMCSSSGESIILIRHLVYHSI